MKDESELVRRASQGDQAAFGRLVELHWSRLVSLARSTVGSADAEDAVQEGLLRAWRKLSQLQEPNAFRAWVSRVVIRVCLKRSRARWLSWASLDEVAEPRTYPDHGTGVEMERLLASLPARQRAVMHLTAVEGMTDAEIGSILGIAASSVRAHRRRARQRLEERFRQRSVA